MAAAFTAKKDGDDSLLGKPKQEISADFMKDYAFNSELTLDMKMKETALDRTRKPHSNSIRTMLRQEKDVLKWLESL